MYYENNDIYISKNKKVLFDLNKLEIYQINANNYNMFNDLYNNKIEANDNNKDMYDLFFKETLKSYKDKHFSDIDYVKIHVSNDCNMQCKYCYANNGDYNKKRKIMSSEEALLFCKIINRMLPNLKRITFFGGEPLLAYKAIDKICSYFKDKELSYNVITNMTILNNEIIEILKKYNIKITCSIDGPKEYHDLYRVDRNGLGTYDKICNNIKLLEKNGVKISCIECTYTNKISTKLAKDELAEFFYEKFKVPALVLHDVVSTNPKLIPSKDLSIQIEKNIQNSIKNIIDNKYLLLNDYIEAIISILTKKYIDFFCSAGINSISIDTFGNVFPCQLYMKNQDYCYFNIFNDDRTINKSNKIRELKSLRKSNLEKCSSCIAKYWCHICLGNQLILKKDINNAIINNNCKLKKMITVECLEVLSEYILNNKFELLRNNIEDLMNVTYDITF